MLFMRYRDGLDKKGVDANTQSPLKAYTTLRRGKLLNT